MFTSECFRSVQRIRPLSSERVLALREEQHEQLSIPPTGEARAHTPHACTRNTDVSKLLTPPNGAAWLSAEPLKCGGGSGGGGGLLPPESNPHLRFPDLLLFSSSPPLPPFCSRSNSVH